MTQDNAPKQPLVAILAAGRAERFGGRKLDAECAGKPLGQWVLDAVENAGLEAGIIITGPHAPQFAQRAEKWDLISNLEPRRGIGSSLALAAREAMMRKSDLLILLADMPLVDPLFLRELAAQKGVAASAHSNDESTEKRAGVPAKFPHAKLGVLINISGDEGAGRVLHNMADVALLTPPADMLRDVDRGGDLTKVEALLG